MRETTTTPYESAIPDITLPEAIKLETIPTMTKTTPRTTTTQTTTQITTQATTTVNWHFNCTDGNWVNAGCLILKRMKLNGSEA